MIGTRDATSGWAYPEPWIVLANGEAVAIRKNDTIELEYRGSRYSGALYVHDVRIIAEDAMASAVLWGGTQLQYLLRECARGERMTIKYLGSYFNQYGVNMYRWQLWREVTQ